MHGCGRRRGSLGEGEEEGGGGGGEREEALRLSEAERLLIEPA